MATNDKNYGPNFQFKGQVKIEDVSKQLDLLVDGINSMIDTYNDAGYVTDIDLNDVSSELSPMDYTLSVGGLKKVLDAYDNTVIGCNVFTDSKKENLYISSGLLLTRNGGYGLPSAVIKNEGQTEIWYSPSKNQYVGDSAAVASTAPFTMPNITSNESWGKFEAQDYMYFRGNTIAWNTMRSISPPDAIAYNATNSTGYNCIGLGATGRADWNLFLIWDSFPKPVTLSEIKYDISNQPVGGGFTPCRTAVDIKVGQEWRRIGELHDVGMGTQTCPVSNVKANGIKITLVWDKFQVPKGSIKNLSIKGMAESTKPAGGGIAGAEDLVKVATLNHNTNKNYLNVTDFRLAPENMRIAANTNINKYWTSSDTVDNQSADRYIAFLPQQSDSDIALYSKLFLPTGCGYTAWGSYPKVAKSRQMYL